MDEWFKELSTHLVEDVLRNKKKRSLVKFTDKQTLRQVLDILSHEDILSGPVISTNNETGRESVIGFVDVLDITGYILSFWRSNASSMDSQSFPGDELFHTPIEKALNFSSIDAPLAVYRDESLMSVLKLFNDPKAHHRIHRVGVLDRESGSLIDILSQSDLISFFSERSDRIPEILRKKNVDQLRLGSSPILLRVDSPLIDVLELLYRNRISGLALVDESFHISTNFSVSDLRGIQPYSFKFFHGSILQFLAKGASKDTVSKKPISTLSCYPDSTFEFVLKKLDTEKIHRLFVVDGSNHPMGVISLGDVLGRLNDRSSLRSDETQVSGKKRNKEEADGDGEGEKKKEEGEEKEEKKNKKNKGEDKEGKKKKGEEKETKKKKVGEKGGEKKKGRTTAK